MADSPICTGNWGIPEDLVDNGSAVTLEKLLPTESILP